MGGARQRISATSTTIATMTRTAKVTMDVAAMWAIWRLVRWMRTPRIDGKVVLITGASRGLGLALARRFARERCRLIICARHEAELERARAELAASGATVVARLCDVADRDQVDELIDEALEVFGRVDIVVNNAGVIQVGPLESMRPEDFGRALAVNFWGPLHVIYALLPHMRLQREGTIVNITSIGGAVAFPHLLPYDCAKAAFVSLSEGLTAELAKDGIRVTTIVPGLMRTGSPENASFKGDARREFGWFSVGDSVRATSIDADRAAARIVAAARRGERQVVVSVQAKLLRLAHALFPGLVTSALAGLNRLLPRDNQGEPHRLVRGGEIPRPRGFAARLLKNMRKAARQYNQYRPRPAVPPAALAGR
jgi:NAD(P)-dependent dehydrogenase (short-subunit alcohol dehydrogenase family)